MLYREQRPSQVPAIPLGNVCECEHTKHFSPRYAGGEAHRYGAVCPSSMHDVRTPFGTFHVCDECARGCLADFTMGGGEHAL